MEAIRKNGSRIFYSQDIIWLALNNVLFVSDLIYKAKHKPSLEKLLCYGLIRANIAYKSPLIRKKGVFRFMPSSIPRNWINNPRPPKFIALSTNECTCLSEHLELLFTSLLLRDKGVNSNFNIEDELWFMKR